MYSTFCKSVLFYLFMLFRLITVISYTYMIPPCRNIKTGEKSGAGHCG
ncbi:hypothetical protein HMPREF9441_02821 [Paraprevotella clara YIT 11840]|uniref:Uncharacterized protein n=1 Tax=Paraprevotella clara YIT 11840 TaxID=762968 RepID=G5STW6_9BACT|nr:hypothetical protein HMPREF9441_02821 [Paraprevotella clara YIT 11840]